MTETAARIPNSSQQRKACRKRFMITGYGEVEFIEIAPTGNVLVRKPGDFGRGYGPFCLMPAAGAELLSKIGDL